MTDLQERDPRERGAQGDRRRRPPEARARRKPPLQQGIIILPSAFTLGNLFFGVYALVAAARGDLTWAGWCVVFASFLDFADGRIARFTRTGSSFGAELDSLVDAISFGVAPAFILYEMYLFEAAWGWILSFVFITSMVIRLARFNVEQGGEAKTHFHGLPSPSAGLILATFHPFSETPFFQSQLAHLPWPQIMGLVTVIVSVLMVSHIPYALVPRIGFRSARGLFNTALVMGGLTLAITVPRYYFFPVMVLYTAWGLVKAVMLGLWERLPERDPLLDREDGEDDSLAEVREVDYRDVAPERYRGDRRRKRPRGRSSSRGESRPDRERRKGGDEG